MKYPGLIFGTLFFYLLIPEIFLLAQTDESEGKLITKIEIVGLKRQSPEAIRTQLQTKENTAFSYKTWREDIQRLHDTGQFAKIEWKFTPDQEGLKIIIEFQENEIVEEIKLRGVKAFNPKTLASDLKLKPGQGLDDFHLHTDLATIRLKYLEKGYYFVEVTFEKIEGLRGTILVYQVREGPRVTVKEVIIKDRTAFPRTKKLFIFPKDPLLSLMTTQSSHWYSAHLYNEQELQVDLVKIKNFYRNEGWLDVNAFVEDLVFSDTKDKVTVIIKVEEGKRYYIRKVRVVDNTVVETDEILRKSPLKERMPYNVKTIMQAIRMIKTLYGKLGYIDCDVETRTHYPEEGWVDFAFHIKEGNQKYLEKIEVTGNIKTRAKVIRREMLIAPGDLMDYEKIENSRDRVAATMYFQSIKYEIEEGSASNMDNLIFQVEEAQTGALQLGGAYSANYGFGGMIRFSQANFDIARLPKSVDDLFSGNAFAGGGQRLSIIWQPGVRTTRYVLNFTEPYLLNKPLKLGFNYSGWEYYWTDYNEKRTGLGVNLTRRFPTGWEIGAGPRLETIDISNLDPDVPTLVSELGGTHRLNGLETSIALDKRDSWLFPTRGYRLGLDLEYCGGSFQGDFDYTKSFLRGEIFTPLIIKEEKKLVLNLIGRLGYVKEFGDSETVPFFDRFYAGGISTVRGFQFRTISPKENDLSVGGNIMGVFNLELTYPLYAEKLRERPYDIVRLVFFFDAGNVQKEWDEFKWDSFRTSAGFGIRLYMGNIPLTFNIGYPIKRQPGDDRDTLQIDIGFMY